MKLKRNVKLTGLQPQMLIAMQVAEYVYEIYDKELVITSACDGKHGTGSLHYVGLAIDIRTRYFTDQQKLLVAQEIRNRLGKEYDVVVENLHIHIEYQPK